MFLVDANDKKRSLILKNLCLGIFLFMTFTMLFVPLKNLLYSVSLQRSFNLALFSADGQIEEAAKGWQDGAAVTVSTSSEKPFFTQMMFTQSLVEEQLYALQGHYAELLRVRDAAERTKNFEAWKIGRSLKRRRRPLLAHQSEFERRILPITELLEHAKNHQNKKLEREIFETIIEYSQHRQIRTPQTAVHEPADGSYFSKDDQLIVLSQLRNFILSFEHQIRTIQQTMDCKYNTFGRLNCNEISSFIEIKQTSEKIETKKAEFETDSNSIDCDEYFEDSKKAFGSLPRMGIQIWLQEKPVVQNGSAAKFNLETENRQETRNLLSFCKNSEIDTDSGFENDDELISKSETANFRFLKSPFHEAKEKTASNPYETKAEEMSDFSHFTVCHKTEQILTNLTRQFFHTIQNFANKTTAISRIVRSASLKSVQSLKQVSSFLSEQLRKNEQNFYKKKAEIQRSWDKYFKKVPVVVNQVWNVNWRSRVNALVKHVNAALPLIKPMPTPFIRDKFGATSKPTEANTEHLDSLCETPKHKQSKLKPPPHSTVTTISRIESYQLDKETTIKPKKKSVESKLELQPPLIYKTCLESDKNEAKKILKSVKAVPEKAAATKRLQGTGQRVNKLKNVTGYWMQRVKQRHYGAQTPKAETIKRSTSWFPKRGKQRLALRKKHQQQQKIIDDRVNNESNATKGNFATAKTSGDKRAVTKLGSEANIATQKVSSTKKDPPRN